MHRAAGVTMGALRLTQRFANPMKRRLVVAAVERPSNLRQAQRNMVMVTQTKATDLPRDTPDDTPAGVAGTTPNYNVLSNELIVTPSCLQRVEKLIKQRDGEGYFLRVYVDAGGCSGFQYMFEVDKEFDEDEDLVVVEDADTKSPRVVVDETSLGFLKGSTLDYVQEMIKSSFVVADNPQSESACGCGSSFAMKNFAANPALD